MGKGHRDVLVSLTLAVILFAVLTIGQDEVDTFSYDSLSQDRTDVRRRSDGRQCCPPCLTGEKCRKSVENMDPKFSSPIKFLEVFEAHKHGQSALNYNSTTYPGDPDCPCDVFVYSIVDVKDVMNPDNKDTDYVFAINQDTGKIYLNDNNVFSQYDMYDVTVSVRNIITDASDVILLTVASGERNVMDAYSPFQQNGYGEDEHVHLLSRHKRSAAPTELTFVLTETSSVSEIRVGTRVQFRLEIQFPDSPVDILIELFTPDNETCIMILCDVQVVVATNLNFNGSTDVTYDSKVSNPYQSDRAVIDLGYVTNNAVASTLAENTFVITYDAVMIENPLAENTTYWVSAGAEYQDSTLIWIGQASFMAVVDGDMSVASSPIFNVTMPVSLALGTSQAGTVNMYLPYPTRDYVFKVFTPTNTTGLVSVCAIEFDSFGDNFMCGNNDSAIYSALDAEPQSAGNAIGTVNLGTLLNKGSRDPVIIESDNRISISFIMHLYPDTTRIGDTVQIGLSLQVDTDTIWIGDYPIAITAAETVGMSNPVLSSTTYSMGSNPDATIGQPFSVTYVISVPQSTTASKYLLEMLAPFNIGSGTPIFSVCSFKVTAVGASIPCLNKDELITEFSSRDPTGASVEPDRAVIDAGYVTNLGTNSGISGHDQITIEAVLKPLINNSDAVVTSTHKVTFGITVGSTYVNILESDIDIVNDAVVTPMNNLTQPGFAMQYYDGDSNVEVTSSTKVSITMTTVRNITYDAMDMEFLMPKGASDTYFHVCRVDIVSSGVNMPCMSPEWYNKYMEYFSEFDTYQMDRARLGMGGMCNQEFVDDTAEDVTEFAVYLKVLDVPDLTHASSHYLSTGLLYSSTSLWVGQLKLDIMRGSSITPTKNTYAQFIANSTSDPVPIGLTRVYSVMMKIDRNDSAHVKVNVTADDPAVHICTVRAYSAGMHLPCVADEVSTRTTEYWPGTNGFRSVVTDLGIITNYGDTDLNMTSNDFYDYDSMMVEIVVRANPMASAGTYGFTTRATFDTAEAQADDFAVGDFVITEDISGISTTITDTVNMTLSFGEIAGGDNTADVAIGETRMVLLTSQIPEGSTYDLEFAFVIPSIYIGKLEIADAAIVTAGDNVPCVDPLQEADISSSDGIYNDVAAFAFGFTCSHVLRPGDTKANTVTMAAYIRVVPNGLAIIGDELTMTSTLSIFSSQVSVESINITVADPANFVDKVASLDGVNNETLVTLSEPDPVVMKIGENKTITVTVAVPPRSVSQFLFDIDLPYDDTACLTVQEVRAMGAIPSQGRNVPSAPLTENNKSIVYTPDFNDSCATGQHNYLYIDLGIVTNTGLTYSRDSNASSDDMVMLEVDIQLADCKSNTHGHKHKISIGSKVGNYIFIYDHEVEVNRDNNELPDIVFESSVNASSDSSTIYIDGIIYHSNTSTAEGYNTTVSIYWPIYMSPTYTFVTSSTKPCTITQIAECPDLIEIFCPNFFFVDIFTFTIQADVNTSVVLPSGYSSSYSVAHCEVKTDFMSDSSSSYISFDWFPYVSSGLHDVAFSVVTTSVSCGAALGLESGAIEDCQITGDLDDVTPATSLRFNGASAWSPFVRSGEHAKNRHVTIYFGNKTQVTDIDVQQDTIAHTHYASELTIEYTNDGIAYFGAETVSLGVSPATLESRALSGTTARGLRISVSDDTSNGGVPIIGVKFELHGCATSSDVTLTEACAVLEPKTSRPSGFKYRNFVAVATTYAFVCDRDPSSKTYRGKCYYSSNSGSQWKRLDQRVASMLGYESTNNHLYAYDQDMSTILMSADLGSIWNSVDTQVLDDDKLLTWTDPIDVPEIASSNLAQATPHVTYTQSTWGATYDGVFESNTLKFSWSATT